MRSGRVGPSVILVVDDPAIAHGPELLAQVTEDAGQKTGHLHLGHADVVGDLPLGQSLEEPELKDVAVASAQSTYEGRQRDACLRG